MRHQPLEEILATATVLERPPTPTRRERLLRWAEILKRDGARLLQPLKYLEFYAPAERARLRADQTPIAAAFADPVLRSAGLAGDSYGEARAFFGLTEAEGHFLLCDCHWRGRMTGDAAARRVRAVANPNFVNRAWMALVAD
jgi:hypothetical protein